MRRFGNGWPALLLALMLAGCVSPVITDHRVGTDFSQYHSYSLAPPQGDQHIISLDGQRVQEALRAALARAGLHPTTDQADLLVRYRFKPVEHFQGSSLHFGFGFWHDHFGVSTQTPVEGTTIRLHRLQVELVDRGDQRVVWQATSRDTLEPGLSSKERDARVKTMIREMFQRYPPVSHSAS